MARLSLFLVALAALGGLSCLITSSPDFAKPTRTPPFLTALNPPPYQVLSRHPLSAGVYQQETVSFQVVSEDLQSPPLQGLLLLDFQGFSAPIERVLYTWSAIPPGHFNDPSAPPRDPMTGDFQFPQGTNPGCYSATLVVSHEFKQELGTNKIKPKDDGDVATATWWYELLGPDDSPSGCGIHGTTPSDGGVDTDGGVR